MRSLLPLLSAAGQAGEGGRKKTGQIKRNILWAGKRVLPVGAGGYHFRGEGFANWSGR